MICRVITSQHVQNYQQPNKNEYEGENQNNKNNAYNARMRNNYQNVQSDRGLHESVWWYDMCRFVASLDCYA